MPWLFLLLTAVCAAIALFAWRRSERRAQAAHAAYRAASKQLEQLQVAFHRFAPQDVVEDIIARGISARGERRDVTVLFADLVGFTSLSESLEPETVVQVLNGYFQRMTRVISSHNGHVGKFIGDGILATFGAPEPNPWQAQDAVRAALAMDRALAEYNLDLQRQGHPALELGVGIHCGPVVAGLLGSSELMEYTVIGDVVNTASRIESLTRKLEATILISDSVRKQLDSRFHLREMAPSEVKGKSKALATWAVDSIADPT
jgi:adenylate cyclase